MNSTTEEETVSVEMLISTEETAQRLMEAGVDRLFAQQSEGIVNPIVLAKCLGVKPQMIYNYIRDGKILSTKQNNTQKLVIVWSDAVEFAQKYWNRKLVRQAKIDAELNTEEATETDTE